MARRWSWITLVLAASLLVPGAAMAHKERRIDAPPRPGTWPDAGRVQPHVVVCKASSRPTQAQLDAIEKGLDGSTGRAHRRFEAKLRNWRYNHRLWPQCGFHNIQAAVDSV